MRTFIADIIPKIQQYSRKLDDLTKLQNQHWVSIGDISAAKTVYIFRDNNQLLISENGRVQKGTWEYLGNQSLLIETKNDSFLFKHGFFDENVIALKLDSNNSYAFFVNENRYDSELNSIDDILKFLTEKYLKSTPQKSKDKFEYHETSLLDPKIRYQITHEEKKSTFFLGSIYWQYEVKYEDGFVGYFYKHDGSELYYYTVLKSLGTEDINCSSKEEVIRELYYYLKKFK